MTSLLVPPTRTPLLTVSRLISSQWERWFSALVNAIPRDTLQYAQADLADLATKTLKREDAGQLVWVSDYRHMLRWTGSAYEFAAGDGPGGYIAAFAVDPAPADGWALCDGAATTYLKADGTTGNYTTPDLIGAGAGAMLKLGDTVSGPNAAVAPTFTGAADTTSAVSAGTPAGTIGIGANSGAGVSIGAGVANASPQGHSHAGTFYGSALGNHDHTVTASGSISADGEPRNIVLRPWFRR